MPPTSKKFGRHIGLGLSVHGSHFAYGQKWLEIGSWNLICGISMKSKRTSIFFSLFHSGVFIEGLYPFFNVFFFFYFAIINLQNLVNKISREPLELGSWYLAYRLCHCVQGLDDLINFWHNSETIWLIYLPFPTLAFCVVKQPCEQNIWRTTWARIMISGEQFGYIM